MPVIRLVVDLSNKSAQVIDDVDREGRPRWMLTSPPDGFWCRVAQVRDGSPIEWE